MLRWLKWFLIAIGLLPHPRPTPTPVPPKPVPVPPTPRPAPRFFGFFFLYSFYDKSERILLNTNLERHGCDADGSSVSYGIEDNGSGPYRVNIVQTRLDTGAQFEVYDIRHAVVGTALVPSGIFYTYLGAKRPWNPASTQPAFKRLGCDPTPVPPPPTPIHPLVKVDITVTIENADGERSRWGQVIEMQERT